MLDANGLLDLDMPANGSLLSQVKADELFPGAVDPFREKVVAASLRVRHQDRARVVDNASVDLLGHSVVETSVPRLHVIDWNTVLARESGVDSTSSFPIRDCRP